MFVPMLVQADTLTIETNTAIMQYSIAVAPDSSAAKRFIQTVTIILPRQISVRKLSCNHCVNLNGRRSPPCYN
jgi:hypothetical protein